MKFYLKKFSFLLIFTLLFFYCFGNPFFNSGFTGNQPLPENGNSEEISNQNEFSENNLQNEELKIRVVSDLIKLPQNATGRYACSKLGLTLVKSNFANSKKFDSGSLIFSEEPTKKIEASAKIDAKSGAKIIEI